MPFKFKDIFDKTGTKKGLTAGLISSLCCITPLTLISLGLGTATFAFSFVDYKLEFLILSLLFLSFSIWQFFKKEQCSIKSKKAFSFLTSTLVVYFLLFFGLVYGLVPLVGPKIYQAKLFASDLGDHQPSCHLQLNIKALELDKLSCSSCAAAAKYTIEQQNGVVKAEIDLKNNQAMIHYDHQVISASEITNAIPNTLEIKNVINYC